VKLEWGVVLKPDERVRPADPESDLLGFGWFERTAGPLTAPAWPARFRTRKAARDAIAARTDTYFAGRFRVVRLTSTFAWEASR
jgi:hypothetical protein